MVTKPDYSKLACLLVNGQPMAFKLYPDGSMNIIAPNGQKLSFTPEQVQQEQDKLSNPAPKPAPKPTKTPRKPANKK